MKILLLDHGKTYGGGQVMAARLLPLLRARGYEIEAWSGCEDLEGDPIPRTHMGLRRAIRIQPRFAELVSAIHQGTNQIGNG